MEHEIYNSDDEIVVEKKHTKKNSSFWNTVFSCEFIAIFFAVLSLALTCLTRFLAFMFSNTYVFGFFFLITFGCAFAGIIFAIIPMIKNKKLTINLQLILSMFAALISML